MVFLQRWRFDWTQRDNIEVVESWQFSHGDRAVIAGHNHKLSKELHKVHFSTVRWAVNISYLSERRTVRGTPYVTLLKLRMTAEIFAYFETDYIFVSLW